MAKEKMKENLDVQLREAVLKNYLVRWAGRSGVPKSHGIGFKLVGKSTYWDSVVYLYDLFLIKDTGIIPISPKKFFWAGHLDKDDAEEIFSHLRKKEILISRDKKYYFNISYKNITFVELQSHLLELDPKGLFTRIISKLSSQTTRKFSHKNTVNYILGVLKHSIIKIEKITVTIGHLGETTLSKSYVFKIIETAGNCEVVKIDPNPLSWEKYMKDLENQREVARHLRPEIDTLVPGVTFALYGIRYLRKNNKYRHMFFHQGHLSPKEQDARFGDVMLQQADKDERLRGFLKVNDSYGYFMPYLKEGILESYFNNIHGYKEIPGTPVLRINDDIQKETAKDFSLLKKDRFELFLKKYHFADNELLHRIKTQYLAGNCFTPEELTEALDKTALKKTSTTLFEAYKKSIKTYLRDSYLESTETRTALLEIITGLLKLFACLRQKGIAIRDLKAGNIFITDTFQQNGMLSLLDFETAILYAPSHGKAEIPQPRLGGTPSRGTPSLWFSNEVLLAYYGELPRSLYLPDLYAIIEIIYAGITREPLFKNGKDILKDIFKVIEGDLNVDYFRRQETSKAEDYSEETCLLDFTVSGERATEVDKPEDDMLEVYKQVNPIYWDTAFREFQEGMHKQKYLLEKIIIQIPKEFSEIIKTEIQLNYTLIANQLLQSPLSSGKHAQILARLDNVLKSSFEEMTAYQLLPLLFEMVSLYMNRISVQNA